MSAGHTPGPWVVCATHDDERFFSVFTKHQLDNDQINSVTSDDFVVSAGLNHDNFEANARLIAAAPDLLQALTMIRDADNDVIRDGLFHHRIPMMARHAIDAAIAKATGEVA